MSKICQIDYNNSLITKSKHTKAQSHLSKIERVENLQSAFKVNEKLIKNFTHKTFIIVDDVVSTGTTLNEISKLLKKQ
jgi:predicted amidophosphoribosyltransferase